MALNLDHPAGWTSRKHPSGMRIYAYLDQPGSYLDEKGRPIGHKLAKEAGYDVDQAILERDKNLRLAEFRQQLDREFSDRAAELDAMAELSGDGIEARPLKAGGYEVLRDGDKVNAAPLDFDEAKRLVEGLRNDEDPADGEAPAAEEAGAAAAKGSGEGTEKGKDGGGLADLM